ncbi:MAG: nitrogenase component 1 [Methanomicrobiaceae archaeon]|nr:nitrogenase component 1 [Methanomicrobiaceae archaeon]
MSRYEGCTITGALAVSAFIPDALTVVHGPAGCAHHNLSLLHATLLQQDRLFLPPVFSTGLREPDIIFGGEDALQRTIERALERKPRAVCVISTCIAETIGDDTDAVCGRDWGVPVIHLHSSGFLGGSFNEGFVNALKRIAGLVPPAETRDGGINIVGEKNLEFEVEENFEEVARLLGVLDLDVNVRFVRNETVDDISRFSAGCLNILREPALDPIGRHFQEAFAQPYLSGFPVGLQGTREFLRAVGEACGSAADEAIAAEESLQDELSAEFADLDGEAISLSPFGFQCPEFSLLSEVAEAIGLRIDPEGTEIPVPFGAPVGTAGIRRMLHQWRRFLHA